MKGRSRYMYLVWDLRQNRIIQSWTLGSPGCHGAYRPVGVTPDGTKLYYIQNDSRVMIGCGPVARSTARAKGMRLFYRLLVMDLVRGSRREVASIAPSQKRLQVLTATKRFDKVAVVEYADMKTNRGRAYVVDTSRGTVRSFVAPLTPYGMAFSRDESRLTIYSAKQGQLVNIALAGGQRTAHKTHKLGHAMGYSRDGRHIYVVFHSGTEVRDAATMKRVGYIKHRAFMGNVKFIHVDGSAVGGGTVFVKNGEKLYVQQLSHGTTAKVLDKKQPGTLPKHKMQPRTPTLRKQPNSPQNAPRLPDTQSVKKQQSDNDWLRGGTAY
jgi:DNA-binding beta-propeller fold protein YncE